MPLRTIQGASFHFQAVDGKRVLAMRGETHDIPEGPDLERGDKFGAFTEVPGQEPTPPEGSFIPRIDTAWNEQEYIRFVDAGTMPEILDRLNDVNEEIRPAVARELIEAEQSRGQQARGPLLLALSQVAELDVTGESEDDGTQLDETPDTELEDETEVDELEPEPDEPEDLDEFVKSNTIDAVLKRANDEPELADALLEAELNRGDDARKTLLDALNKIGS